MVERIPDKSDLLAAIVESSDDAIISKDLNGIVTSWNRAAERIFGYTVQEMVGRPVFVLAPPDRPDEMASILRRIRRGERVDHYETKRRRKDGVILDIALTVSPVRDEAGEIVGASKIARDITDRKRAEAMLLRQAELLARSNADLQQFAYITSHDLQEPLRTIASFSELLRRNYRGRLDREADEFIDYVIGAATRMSTLIRDVLSYSRLLTPESANATLTDMREALEWAIRNLESTIRENEAVVDAGHLPTIMAESTAIAQVFQNLLSNALKYRSAAPPHIRVDAAEVDGEWVFSVADNGAGIAPEYQSSIFGLFRRLHGAAHPGTGIGLALCKKIVERHGGRIWVESQPGAGSVFRFTIPQPQGEV